MLNKTIPAADLVPAPRIRHYKMLVDEYEKYEGSLFCIYQDQPVNFIQLNTPHFHQGQLTRPDITLTITPAFDHNTLPDLLRDIARRIELRDFKTVEEEYKDIDEWDGPDLDDGFH
ncbi:MAG: hypothetical protein M1305_06105 [Candidatus Marsarchaeota archaeon]|nr:hypothetical protein [Candidatus Marsarchaeota archaeon]